MTTTASTPTDQIPLTITVRSYGESIVDIAVAWPGVRPFVSVAVRERDGLWLVHPFAHRDTPTPCYRTETSRDAAVGLAVRLAEMDGRRLTEELASVPAAGV